MTTVQEIRKSLFDIMFPNHQEIADALTLAASGFTSDQFNELYKFARANSNELIAIYDKGQTLDDVQVKVIKMNGEPMRNTVQMTTDILKAKYGNK